MPSLADLAVTRTALTEEQIARLHAVVADWQLLADLSFADLVLWLHDSDRGRWWAVAQVRPTTGPTTLDTDIVGTWFAGGPDDRPERSSADPETRTRTIDVGHDDQRIAVITQHRPGYGARVVSPLESAYLDTAGILATMVRRGEYPNGDAHADLTHSLRVGDGFVRVDRTGIVTFASPNAVSAYRRLGHDAGLAGEDLVALTTPLLTSRPTDRGFAGLFDHDEAETELVGQRATLLARIVRLTTGPDDFGSLLLLRDVTELRLRERELVSKEATIREIHHRVKNNLQTVAALLRLQSRRLDIPEAKSALAEAERRVGSIALVHETLSKSFDDNVDFDAIADTLLRSVLDGQHPVRRQRIGTFGTLPGEVATPLAMVLTELLQNTFEHAFPEDAWDASRGPRQVTVAANRIRQRLRLRISDNGVGLPTNFDPAASLGLSIVSTLVEGELGGELVYEKSPRVGTTVAISLDVRSA